MGRRDHARDLRGVPGVDRVHGVRRAGRGVRRVVGRTRPQPRPRRTTRASLGARHAVPPETAARGPSRAYCRSAVPHDRRPVAPSLCHRARRRSALRPTVEGVTTDMAVAVAESVGVCVRPILRTVTDRATGHTTAVPIPCGSTRSSRCPPVPTRPAGCGCTSAPKAGTPTDEPAPGRREPRTDDDLDQDADDPDEDTRSRRVGPGPPVAGMRRRTCPPSRSSTAPSAEPSPTPDRAASTGPRCSSP